jgi:hypothetical protein
MEDGVVTMTAEERRARYRERHGGTCVDCGARTSLTRKGAVSTRCDACYRASVTVEHGWAGYTERGCRCDTCRAANASAQRRWQIRNSGCCTGCGVKLRTHGAVRCRSCNGQRAMAQLRSEVS